MRGCIVFAIVHQDKHISFFEIVHVHEIIHHVVDIVVAGLELALLSHIIDTNEQGTLVAHTARWDNVHGLVNVNLQAAGQLRVLNDKIMR